MDNDNIVSITMFSKWLSKSTSLSESSIYKYSHAISTISDEMIKMGIIHKSLMGMPLYELEVALMFILHNEHFTAKNIKGNHMYSNALKQYRSFIASTQIDDGSQDFVNAIQHDLNISETQRAAIVNARIGQGVFRNQLLEKYNSQCIITGINHPRLLVASHIRPWAVSSNDERLQLDNGLLLSATFDRLFDAGLITFDNNGRIYISSFLGASNEKILNISRGAMYQIQATDKMKQHLEYHRDVIFVK